MITAHILRSVFDHRPAETIRIPFREGLTAADLVRDHRCEDWRDSHPIAVTVEGRRLNDDELDLPLRDGADVVLCPVAGDPLTFIVGVVIVGLLVLGGFVYRRLVAQQSTGPQDRGDDSSPVYAFDRIHSEYRAGYPVPIAYGEHDLGGQLISTRVLYSRNTEVLAVIIALSAGQCHSIGGIQGSNGAFNQRGTHGGTNRISTGAFPSDVRVNGNRIAAPNTVTAQAWGRLGWPSQSPLPDPPWSGVATTQLVNGELPDLASEFTTTISDTKKITQFVVVIGFPSGLYETNLSTGEPQAYAVGFKVSYREVGGPLVDVANFSLQGPYVSSTPYFTNPITINTEGPIEIRVLRVTPRGATNVVSFATFRQVVYYTNEQQSFAYPNVALLGLEVPGTEQTTGGRAEFVIRGKWRMVRVWDAAIGGAQPSVDRYWEAPDGIYSGIWAYPAGQNPAWILADFLTSSEGLGDYVSDDDIDWPVFRDWADFCDQDATVDGDDEAYLQFDGIFDTPQPAWDIIRRICQAGRATPLIVNNKFTIKYNYSGAHGRGTNTVAAKAVTQLVTSSNVTDFTVTYLNTRRRPAVVDFQYLNKDKDYAQDTEPVEDPNGGFNHPATFNPLPYYKETQQLFGVTRRSQVIREGLFFHNVNRTVRSECGFRIGPEGLAAQIGDLIAVQHDAFRPYDTEAYAYRIAEDAATSTEIKLDRTLTLAAATTYQLQIRKQNGDVVTVTILESAGTYAAGTSITIDTIVTVRAGGLVVFGVQNKLTKTYEVIEISLEQNLMRKVRAVEWVSANHDIETLSSLEQVAVTYSSEDQLLVDDNSASVATGIKLVRLPSRWVLGWEQPTPYASRVARVFYRPSSEDGWRVAGDAKQNSIELPFLKAGEQYVVAVAIADSNGQFQAVDDAGQATVTADEFPGASMTSISRADVVVEGRAIVVRWPAVDSPALEYYELRRGTTAWYGAQILGRTKETELRIPLPPVDTSDQVGTLIVSARAKHGLYSAQPLVVASTAAPYSGDSFLVDEDLDPSVDGTHSGTQWSTDHVELTALAMSGTWTSDEVALGYDVTLGLSIGVDSWAEDQITVDELDFEIDSGEARWRTVNGREGSPASPGINPDETVDDLTTTIDDLPENRQVGTYKGESGHNALVRLWFRTALDSESISSKAWELYKPGVVRELGRVQMRVELIRAALTTDVYAKTLTLRGVA